jgi:hypothetical protein
MDPDPGLLGGRGSGSGRLLVAEIFLHKRCVWNTTKYEENPRKVCGFFMCHSLNFPCTELAYFLPSPRVLYYQRDGEYK